MTENPIAGVDLEAEQVVEEEAEKPVSSKKKKLRPSFLIFGGILVVEAVVLFIVFGMVGGGTPSEGGGEAHAEEEKTEINPASLEEMVNRGILPLGDISHAEPSPHDPKRFFEVTLAGLEIVFDEEGWKAIQKVVAKNEQAEGLIKIDLQRHVRAFMSSRGAQLIVRRGDTIADDLLFYFRELHEDSIGGLSQHIVDIGFAKVKQR